MIIFNFVGQKLTLCGLSISRTYLHEFSGIDNLTSQR